MHLCSRLTQHHAVTSTTVLQGPRLERRWHLQGYHRAGQGVHAWLYVPSRLELEGRNAPGCAHNALSNATAGNTHHTTGIISLCQGKDLCWGCDMQRDNCCVRCCIIPFLRLHQPEYASRRSPQRTTHTNTQPQPCVLHASMMVVPQHSRDLTSSTPLHHQTNRDKTKGGLPGCASGTAKQGKSKCGGCTPDCESKLTDASPTDPSIPSRASTNLGRTILRSRTPQQSTPAALSGRLSPPCLCSLKSRFAEHGEVCSLNPFTFRNTLNTTANFPCNDQRLANRLWPGRNTCSPVPRSTPTRAAEQMILKFSLGKD